MSTGSILIGIIPLYYYRWKYKSVFYTEALDMLRNNWLLLTIGALVEAKP